MTMHLVKAGESLMPWVRLPEEPTEANGYFQVYRKMGPSRSITAAVRQWLKESSGLLPGEPLLMDDSLVRKWAVIAKDWHWDERAAAWDDHMRKLEMAEEERVAKERVADMVARHAEAGQAVQKAGVRYFFETDPDNKIVYEQVGTDPDGQPIMQPKVKPLDDGHLALKALAKGVEIERLARNLPTEYWASTAIQLQKTYMELAQKLDLLDGDEGDSEVIDGEFSETE